MILERLYKVVLLDGTTTQDSYDTRQEAVRAHRGNIEKLLEIIPNVKKSDKPVKTGEALLISKRDNDDLDISLDCGYSVTYNCPKIERLYEGMKYLEVSKNKVLVAEVVRIEKYEKSIHHHWIGPGYKPDKEWAWAIYHKNGNIMGKDSVETLYNNKLKGTQGGISYIKI